MQDSESQGLSYAPAPHFSITTCLGRDPRPRPRFEGKGTEVGGFPSKTRAFLKTQDTPPQVLKIAFDAVPLALLRIRFPSLIRIRSVGIQVVGGFNVWVFLEIL